MPERRRFGSELAERIENVGDLKAHDIVWTRCDWHGEPRFHRGWLTERTIARDLRGRPTPGWVCEPSPHGEGPGRFIVADNSIPDGYVWRVVDEQRDDIADEHAVRVDEARAAMRALPRRLVPAKERS